MVTGDHFKEDNQCVQSLLKQPRPNDPFVIKTNDIFNRYNSVPQMLILTLTCLLTSSAVNCSLATPGMRLTISEAISL